MTRKVTDSKLEVKSKNEEELDSERKKKFIKKFLKDSRKEFEEYNEGYKIFSVTTGKPDYFKLDDKMVTNIVNRLTLKYQCELISTSRSLIPPYNIPLYTLEFFKK
jgi:hypothetical protein